jgi:hypothetical protein
MIKSRGMRWAGHTACMDEKKRAYRFLVEKPEGKRPLERPRHRLDNNIKMNLNEKLWGALVWINLAQWRIVVKTVMNFQTGGF